MANKKKTAAAQQKRQTITDAEMAVMKVLWEQGPLSVKAIAEAIYSHAAQTEVGTIHTLLKRLEKKGLTTRDRSTHAHLVIAAVSQSEVAGQELEALADKVADGSLAPFLTHLVGNKRLGENELAELRKLLEKHSK